MPEQAYLTRRERREALSRAAEPVVVAPAAPEPPSLDLDVLRAYTKALAEERVAAQSAREAPAVQESRIAPAPPATTTPPSPEPPALPTPPEPEAPAVPVVTELDFPGIPTHSATQLTPEDDAKPQPAPTPPPAKKPRVRTVRKPKPARVKRPWWRLVIDFLAIMLAAALLVVLFKTVVFRMFFVPSASMEPTLQINDHLVTELVSSRFDGYHAGDIVVFRDPDNWLGNDAADEELNVLQILGILPESRGYLVKRVIGEPGDVVEGLPDGTILVNNVPLPEDYAALPAESEPFTATVTPGHYWMMGDNRGNSTDSRFHGEVAESDFVGKVVFRLMPLDRFGPVG